jgi:Zn finger protein HypA/HybF involved in hydrogenase expression
MYWNHPASYDCEKCFRDWEGIPPALVNNTLEEQYDIHTYLIKCPSCKDIIGVKHGIH